jgi:hypothetical protein
VRHVEVFTGCGQQTDGRADLTGPVRSRPTELMAQTGRAVRSRVVDFETIESMRGSWGHCFGSRRALYSLFFQLFSLAPPYEREGSTPARLPTRARNGFSMATALGALTISCMRAMLSEFLYCVAASPGGAGACKTKVPAAVAEEIWRRGGKRGKREVLESREVSNLRRNG